MSAHRMHGYAGKLLRVNLTTGRLGNDRLNASLLRKYVGGVGLAGKILYDEVPPRVEWNDAANRLILATGPLAGTKISGSGTFCVVTKGPMTNLAGSTQANGFFGAFLKSAGFDGIVIEGCANQFVYLYIHDGQAELREARHLVGKDTFQTEEAIKSEFPGQTSVFSIGPAGENLVRFAALIGDTGHVAAHNGVGAVMGSKRLKAIAVARGLLPFEAADKEGLSAVAKQLVEHARTYRWGYPFVTGTATGYSVVHETGLLPVKNYTTSLFPAHAKFGEYMRSHFEIKRKPCWACRSQHCHFMKVTEGPYSGYEGEEPEYEALAAWGSQIGQTDPGAALMLADLTDRLGLDVNEAGWIIGWVMECCEKGILTAEHIDGLAMTWGDAKAVAALLHKIAYREGIGSLLAEGVKRAAEVVGGDAPNLAVYTLKGATPRGHDHRANWRELLDTCVSGTSTIEATGGYDPPEELGLPPLCDPFSAEEIPKINALMNWRRIFEDCLGTCRFCTTSLPLTIQALNCATGWMITEEDARIIGRRVVNLLRAFNIRHGLTPEQEAPSPRYGSAPMDGPVRGRSITPYWEAIRRSYYQHMGWDSDTGIPLPKTLRGLGLEEVVADLWGEESAD